MIEERDIFYRQLSQEVIDSYNVSTRLPQLTRVEVIDALALSLHQAEDQIDGRWSRLRWRPPLPHSTPRIEIVDEDNYPQAFVDTALLTEARQKIKDAGLPTKSATTITFAGFQKAVDLIRSGVKTTTDLDKLHPREEHKTVQTIVVPESPVVSDPRISPKSSYQWLAVSNIVEFDVRAKIGEEILINARELNPNVHWGVILDAITFAPGSSILSRDTRAKNSYRGAAAVSEAFARGIGITAKIMGWGMDHPSVVYMSGSGVKALIGSKLGLLDRQIAAINKGETIYSSDEIRQSRLDEMSKEASELGEYRSRIDQALEEYAKLAIPESADPDYLKVLTNLPWMGHGSKRDLRNRVYTNLKSGNYASALQSFRS